MSLHVKAACAERILHVPRLPGKYRSLRLLWSACSRPLAVLAWFGACGATLFGALMLHGLMALLGAHVSGRMEKACAAASIAFVLVACLGAGVVFFRRLRHLRLLDFDLLALCLGSALAIWYLLQTP